MPSHTLLTEAERDVAARRGSEWAAAMHILRCPLLARDGRVWRHVERDWIDFVEMEKEGTYSSGELALVQIAGNLFDGSLAANLNWAFAILSRKWAEIVLEAMRLRGELDRPLSPIEQLIAKRTADVEAAWARGETVAAIEIIATPDGFTVLEPGG